MKKLTLNFPDAVGLNDSELVMLIASTLDEKGKLSLGQAAEVASMNKRDFVEQLGNYGVSIFNYPPTDLTRDVRNA